MTLHVIMLFIILAP